MNRAVDRIYMGPGVFVNQRGEPYEVIWKKRGYIVSGLPSLSGEVGAEMDIWSTISRGATNDYCARLMGNTLKKGSQSRIVSRADQEPHSGLLVFVNTLSEGCDFFRSFEMAWCGVGLEYGRKT